MSEHTSEISIWFFVGVLLTVYGVLITGAGIYGLVSPPERLPVLANLHPAIWWGALMLIIGVGYTWAFRPRKGRD